MPFRRRASLRRPHFRSCSRRKNIIESAKMRSVDLIKVKSMTAKKTITNDTSAPQVTAEEWFAAGERVPYDPELKEIVEKPTPSTNFRLSTTLSREQNPGSRVTLDYLSSGVSRWLIWILQSRATPQRIFEQVSSFVRRVCWPRRLRQTYEVQVQYDGTS